MMEFTEEERAILLLKREALTKLLVEKETQVMELLAKLNHTQKKSQATYHRIHLPK